MRHRDAIIPLHEFTSPRPRGEGDVTIAESCDVCANYYTYSCVPAAPPWKGTLWEHRGGEVMVAGVPVATLNIFLNHDVMIYGIRDFSSYDFTIRDSSSYDVTICVISASSGHDVTTYFNVSANFDSPMKTRDDSTIDGTIGPGT